MPLLDMTDSAVDKQSFWTPSKIISGCIGLFYFYWVGYHGGGGAAYVVIASVLLPMGCIWFPEPLAHIGRPKATSPSLPIVVFVLGWVLLLLPVVRILVYLNYV